MPSVNAIQAGHAGRRDFPAEGKYIAGIRAELNMIAIDKALHLAMLMRPVEGARDNVALLHNLNRLQRASRLIRVIGVNGPGSR